MANIIDQIIHIQMLDHLIITFLLLIPIILIARTVVSGTYYSPTLIIVIFGLLMGYALVKGNVATPGSQNFPIIILMSKVTVIALIASFFVGGQEIKKLIFKSSSTIDDSVSHCDDEILLGTKSTQLMFIIRAFFILLGVEGITRLILGVDSSDPLYQFYPILAYIGLAGAIILIDPKAQIKSKRQYLKKGIAELLMIITILVISSYVSKLFRSIIPLPQIFFVMIISSSLGAIFSEWRFGPTFRALLFGGIPIVLAANFIIGGSLFSEILTISSLKSVMAFGLFGQLLWMFGGLTLLIYLGKVTHVDNLGPGMAGALSHSGLTGACTAGDLGEEAASKAPIMINIPFLGHIFIFSILASSSVKGKLRIGWVIIMVVIGIIFTALSILNLRKSKGNKPLEVKGLIQFSFGFQIIAVFGSFLILTLGGMGINESALGATSAISHFGLFAATQGGMFGSEAAQLIPLIFAMPFLIHPFVFGTFGKAMSNNGVMPKKLPLALFILGIIGVILSVTLF